jgi:hypothetical protein
MNLDAFPVKQPQERNQQEKLKYTYAPFLALILLVSLKLAINRYMEVFNYGNKGKNNDLLVINYQYVKYLDL